MKSLIVKIKGNNNDLLDENTRVVINLECHTYAAF